MEQNILAAVLLMMGFQTVLVAFVADLLAANRLLLEDIRFSLKRGPDLPDLHAPAHDGPAPRADPLSTHAGVPHG